MMSYASIEYVSQFGSARADQGEVRCKSVATIITVIEMQIS